jgi:hypothetical protein
MEQDSFKIENLRSEVAFDFLKRPHGRIQYLKFAVHYQTAEGIRMQYFTEWVKYVDGAPRVARDTSYMLTNNKTGLEYLAHHSVYTAKELYHAIADKLDHILQGGDNTPVQKQAADCLRWFGFSQK